MAKGPKVAGLQIKCMVTAACGGLMENPMKVILRWTRGMELASLLGQMDAYTMVGGCTVSSTEKANTRINIVRLREEDGNMADDSGAAGSDCHAHIRPRQ